MVCECQEPGSGLAVVGASGGQSGWQPGLRSSEGSTGVRGSTSTVTNTHAWHVSAEGWRRPQFLVQWTSPQGSLSVLTTWLLTSPKASDSGQNKAKARMCILWPSFRNHNTNIPFGTQVSPVQCGRRLATQGHECPEARIAGRHLGGRLL